MALKGKRIQKETHIGKMCSNVAERGYLLIQDTGDFVKVGTAIASGQLVAGMLLEDVVTLDLTNQPSNQYKFEVPVSGMITLAREGEYLTDAIPTGVTIAPFEDAYYAADGKITNVADGVLDKKVGQWLTAKDADGFALLSLEL